MQTERPRESGNTHPKGASALHRVYEQLRADLIAGQFAPGEKLRIEDVCDRYHIGPSPVREAMSRLAESGLIVALPQRGYRVAEVSTAEYADLVEMRLKLEPDALYRSIKSADIDWEARVAGAYQRLASAQRMMKTGSAEAYRNWAQEDRGFHTALISNCGSPWLLNFCRVIHEQTARYHRSRILEGIAPARKTEDEHSDLMRAALDRNAQLATDLLLVHIRSVSDRIGDALAHSVKESAKSA